MAGRKRHFVRNGLIYLIGMMALLVFALIVAKVGHGPIWPFSLYGILALPASIIPIIMSVTATPDSPAYLAVILLIAAPALNVALLALVLRMARYGGEGSAWPVTRTWDGEPVAAEPPIGATVVVYRIVDGEPEFLLLHRANRRPEDGDDWEWTPPAGARRPKESVLRCARRELEEETGLRVRIRYSDGGDPRWSLFKAEVPADVEVTLDSEHDRFEWVPLPEAERRCRPERVARQIEHVFSTVES